MPFKKICLPLILSRQVLLYTSSNIPCTEVLFVFKHLRSALVFVFFCFLFCFFTLWPDTFSVVHQHVQVTWSSPWLCVLQPHLTPIAPPAYADAHVACGPCFATVNNAAVHSLYILPHVSNTTT